MKGWVRVCWAEKAVAACRAERAHAVRRAENAQRGGLALVELVAAVVLMAMAPAAWADEPYARSRTYDLQNARIELRFDTAARKITGDVTHTLAPLADGLKQLDFDSVGLKIDYVTVGGKPAKFETTADKLIVRLDQPARAGRPLTVRIRYEGQPKKGLYFILPDKDYPDRPAQIWTQGETEDTRYYIPIYDYPNDKTTSEMILTVPAAWTTVANGKLVSSKPAANSMKTWHWRQDKPHSTYLIAVVAGEFDVVTETWRGLPVTYYAPRGRGDRLQPTFGRTPQMIELFSKLFGPYPWDKYGQAMVDEFIAGGMENTSITINTSSALTHPALVTEYISNQDGLISHELGHQWFGDLITTKDWGHVWLNESFASYLAILWDEHHYGAEEAAYSGWQEQNNWFNEEKLFGVPLKTHNFESFVEIIGNVYPKGSRILHMLRHELGDADFYRGVKHFLEKYRYQSVESADLSSAIEEATGKNVDRFFDQWVYGAGAPRLVLSYTWDSAAKKVMLPVRQTQKPEGYVGIFRFPITVEILTAAGAKPHAITVSKAEETFALPCDEKPLTVIFDPENIILKRAEFTKEPADWIYQLQHAPSMMARLEAAVALGSVKENTGVVTALGEAARSDKFWGIRSEAVKALGKIASAPAQQQIVAALADESVTVRRAALDMMGRFKDNPAVAAQIEKAYRDDKAWRVRQAALAALARQKPAGVMETLQRAIAGDSPDDILRNEALRGIGFAGSEENVPLLLEWSAPGKREATRIAAIGSLAKLDKKNGEITRTLVRYLEEPLRSPTFQFTVFNSLVQRGDTSAVQPLEHWLSTSSSLLVPFVRPMLAQLKNPDGGAQPGAASAATGAEGAKSEAATQRILEALQRLEKAVTAMDERLKKIEEKVGKN